MIGSGRRRIFLALAALGALGLGSAPVAAAEPVAAGWWWLGRPSTTFPALFAPSPEPPEGGLYVAATAAGPSGVSALRFELSEEVTATTLTLRIAEASGTPVIDACVATGTWEPAENGGWDQRPEPDCDLGSVAGTLDEEEAEMTFSLFGLQDDFGIIDIVFVPGEDPETQAPTTFSVAFEALDDEALIVAEPFDPANSPAPVPPARAPEIPPAPGPEPPPGATLTSPAPAPFVPSVVPRAPASADEPATTDEATTDTFAEDSSPTLAAGFLDDQVFAYPAVLALPLVLLVGGSYLAWALNRPVDARLGAQR